MIAPIQYLRGLAALLVVMAHCSEQLTTTLPHLGYLGQCGVDIFFVISGFIMSTITERKDKTAGPFMLNRLIRIVPPYWFFTLLAAALLLMHLGDFRHTVFRPGHLVLSMLFIPHANPGLDSYSPLLRVGWTLNQEMIFYILYAASMSLTHRGRDLLVGAAILLLVLLGAVFRVGGPLVALVNSLQLEFVFGIFIANLYRRDLYRRLGALGSAMSAACLAVAILALLAATVVHPGNAWRPLTFGMPTALLVLGVLRLDRPAISEALKSLGDASYVIYLSHIFIVSGLRVTWGRLHLDPYVAAFVVAAMALTSAFAILFHHFVEKPAHLWLRKAVRTAGASWAFSPR